MPPPVEACDSSWQTVAWIPTNTAVPKTAKIAGTWKVLRPNETCVNCTEPRFIQFPIRYNVYILTILKILISVGYKHFTAAPDRPAESEQTHAPDYFQQNKGPPDDRVSDELELTFNSVHHLIIALFSSFLNLL